MPLIPLFKSLKVPYFIDLIISQEVCDLRYSEVAANAILEASLIVILVGYWLVLGGW